MKNIANMVSAKLNKKVGFLVFCCTFFAKLKTHTNFRYSYKVETNIYKIQVPVCHLQYSNYELKGCVVWGRGQLFSFLTSEVQEERRKLSIQQTVILATGES